jgi:hypothetical protein
MSLIFLKLVTSFILTERFNDVPYNQVISLVASRLGEYCCSTFKFLIPIVNRIGLVVLFTPFSLQTNRFQDIFPQNQSFRKSVLLKYVHVDYR